jgi:hypothetical protein
MDYTARRSGTTGHEILNPDGEVICWTVDGGWAETIVGLLNRVGGHRTGTPPTTPSSDAADIRPPGGPGIPDIEPTARQAISHLAYNGLSVRCELAGEPSDAVRSMVESYFRDGEILATASELACRYVMRRLADDHLGLGRIEITDDSRHEDPGVRRMPREDGNPSAGS